MIVAQIKPDSIGTPLFKLRATVKGSTRPAYLLEARVKVDNADGSVSETGLALHAISTSARSLTML